MALAQQARSLRRRDDIVRAAWRLFSTAGYHATSVNSIIAHLGISKGSFYHHFESKEAVLNAGIEQMTTDVLRDLTARLDDADLTATERLNLLFGAGWQLRDAELQLVVELFGVLLREENAIMREKLNATKLRVVRPVLVDTIARGIDEGAFDVQDPALTADFLLVAFTAAEFEAVRKLMDGEIEPASMQRHTDFLLQCVERLLGAKPGSLHTVAPSPLFEALAAEALAGAPDGLERAAP